MKKASIKLIIFILIALLLEIFIFNFGCFRTLFSGVPSTNVEHIVDNSSGKAIIYINDINEKVTSIRINYNENEKYNYINAAIQNNTSYAITYNISFMLNGYSTYTKLDSKTIDINKDSTFLLDTTVQATSIAIETSNTNLPKIESITINEPIFNFSLIRISIVLIYFMIIDLLKNKNILKFKYNFDDTDSVKKGKTIITDLIVVGLFACILITYIHTQYPFTSIILKDLDNTTLSEPALSASALLHNNGKLDLNVSDELKALDDPYDYPSRQDNNINYYYDVCYYNGSYYSYFGIAPILTCVIPLRILTSFYYSSIVYTALFLIASLFIGFIVYKLLIKKFTNKNIPTILFYLGYFAIIFGSNYLTLLRGWKYDLAIASGIFYILLSMYFVLTLNKKTILKCILLGFSLCFIVLSKPSYIIYYPILLLLAIPQIKELYFKCKEKNKLAFIKYIIFTTIPIAILAIFQMWYNNIRFGSIIEFGAKYQLTSYNMTILMSFSFSKIIYGLLKFIFTLPIINAIKFPFVFAQSGIILHGLNEITYQTRIIGLISIPILYILLFKNIILNNIESKKLDKKSSSKIKEKIQTSKMSSTNKYLNIIINALLICGVLLIAITTCMGGIGENYISDFKVLLCMFSAILWFKLLEKNDNELIIKLFIITCIITLLLFIPLSFSGESNLLQNQNLPLSQLLAHTFEFWK